MLHPSFYPLYPLYLCVCVHDGAAPDVPEPFATLEMIYEEMGDEDKRFQVSGQAFLVLLVGKHAVEFGRKRMGQGVGQGEYVSCAIRQDNPRTV